MIPVPGRKLILLLLLPLLLLGAGIFNTPLLILGIAFDVMLLAACLYDYYRAVDTKLIRFDVISGTVFSIGRINPFTVKVSNHSTADLVLELALDMPSSWEDHTGRNLVQVAGRGQADFRFRLRPARRGVYTIRKIYFRYATGAGLFTINASRETACRVEVFPDIKELNQYLLLSRKNRLAGIGIHKNRYRGMGTELEYLREYRSDDDANTIEWKVTTRINRPVCKVFQMESSNQVTIVLDCGRLMTAGQGGLNTMDYAVNAILILAHIVFRMGDQLSLVAYADRIVSELPPTKGKDALKKVTRFLARLQPEFVESNYKLVFEYLRRRLQKRSIIIFFTDMIDDINYGLFRKYLSLLNNRHLTLFILLQDQILQKYTEADPQLLSDLCDTAAATELFLKRRAAVAKLRLSRINVLDIVPTALTPRLIDKYLQIKSRNLI